jgi:hypothetical protein
MAVERVGPDGGLCAEFEADYADAFIVAADGDRPARSWASAALGGAEVAGGLFARVAWHGVLGFELAPPSAEVVAGWRVTTEQPERLVLDVDGRLMAGRIVFDAGDGGVRWTTMLRYHRPAAGRVWRVAGPVHRALAPRCLAQAARGPARSSAPH